MADLPVSLDDLKKHLNIDISDDDALLEEYETAAVELAGGGQAVYPLSGRGFLQTARNHSNWAVCDVL